MDLTHVFRSHLDADRMKPEDIKKLFSPPPGFGSCLQPTNQVLIGPRGSGKSIALRWLSYMHQRPEHIPGPMFYGVRVRIGRYQFDHFKQTFARTDDGRPFLAYLNWYLLSILIEDLRREHWRGRVRLALPSPYRRAISRHDQLLAQNPYITDENIGRLAALVNEIHGMFCKQVEASDIEPGLLAYLTSIQDTINLLHSFGDLILEVHGYDVLAILVDGLDHLGALGRSLAPLLSKDEPFADRIVFKAACRELPRYLYAESAEPRLEEGRDYFIVPVGYYDDDSNFERHLESIMINRLNVYAGNSDMPQLSSLIPESTDRPYSGFTNIAKFAAGNVLVFLETCALALMREQEVAGRADVLRLSPESQELGVEQKSNAYFNNDLDYQVGDAAESLRKYLEAFGRLLASNGAAGTLSINVDIGSLPDIADAAASIRDLIAKACEFRYMSVARALLVPIIRRDREVLPTRFDLSPTLAPRFGLKLTSGPPFKMDRANVEKQIESASHVYAKQQGELFGTEPYLFLSIPGDGWGRSVKGRILAALQRIQSPASTTLGEDRLKLVTFQEVSQWKPGKYLDNLIHALKHSQYVIFDITGGPASGVVVEIGITSGLRKPHAFCWFGDKPFEQSGSAQAFNPQLVPEELRSADIKIISRDARPGGFYKWFQRNVHGPCIVRSEMCGFQGIDGACTCSDVKPDRNRVYVWVQPRNRKLQDSLITELSRRGIDVQVPSDFGDTLSVLTCGHLRSVGGAIFDVSRMDVEPKSDDVEGDGIVRIGSALNLRYGTGSAEVLPLLQVGYALGMGLSHSCIYRAESGCIKSSMLPVKTSFADADFSRSVEKFIDWFIDRQLNRG
jgi:hypothetical protein